jgi:DNA adenine methylase
LDLDVANALERARAVLNDRRPQTVEKTIWGSPAGKKRLAKRLASLLPAHKTYVEPFVGSGAVLFAKEPSAVEVIGDADPEIAAAFKTLKSMSAQKLARLRRMSWKGDEATFRRLIGAKPKGEVEKLHRFLYLSHFSYGKLRGKSFNHNAAGIEANTLRRIEQFAPRLKNVRVHSGDYLPLVRKYDAKDTVFFLDPPYAGYNVEVGEDAFDEEQFFEVLQSIKGRWLLTYGIRGKLPQLLKGSKFEVRRIRTQRGIRSMRGVGGPKLLTQLLVANYSLAKKRAWLEPWEGQLAPADVPHGGSVPAASDAEPFSRSIALIKGADPEDERYVLGVVLEPDVVDAQQDTYSADEIRKAAHRFMEAFRGIGLQHRMRVNDKVKILESFLAPTDFAIGEVSIRKGTWLFAVRILSDELWELVKSGALTGFSIGGSARRHPEPTTSSASEAA